MTAVTPSNQQTPYTAQERSLQDALLMLERNPQNQALISQIKESIKQKRLQYECNQSLGNLSLTTVQFDQLRNLNLSTLDLFFCFDLLFNSNSLKPEEINRYCDLQRKECSDRIEYRVKKLGEKLIGLKAGLDSKSKAFDEQLKIMGLLESRLKSLNQNGAIIKNQVDNVKADTDSLDKNLETLSSRIDKVTSSDVLSDVVAAAVGVAAVLLARFILSKN